MNKFISTAVLLAASTALASAATVELSQSTDAAAIVLTLNVDAFKDINGSYFGGWQEVTKIFEFSGTWSDQETGTLGACNNGSSSAHTTTIYTCWTKDSSSGTGTATGLSETLFDSSTDWDSITAISLVYAYFDETSATRTNTAVSILFADGTIQTSAATATNIVFSGVHGFTTTGYTTTDSLVLSAQFLAESVSLESAKSLSIAAVPEPSAFGLLAGAGALALVAARRRRRSRAK